MKQHKKSGFFLKLTMVLAILVAICFGAYFAIDRLVVPKYFSQYGIHDLGELVGMMQTLYNSPKESEIITNGYTKADETSANKKLVGAGFPKEEGTGKIDYVGVSKGEATLQAGVYHFTDKELGCILNDILASGVVESNLQNLNYLSDISITVLEFIVNPKPVQNGENFTYSNNSADISSTFKIDTSLVREQMAKAMDTPLFLLNMIIPKTIYITVNYSISLGEDGNWKIDEKEMGINGRTAKQSDILIDLMISFIFPPEDEMTKDKMIEACGQVLLSGIEFLGALSFEYNIDGTGTNGVVITMN